MLGADVVVAEAQSLAKRELEHLLGARRERDLARRHLVALADDAGNLRADLLDGDVERLEDAGREAFFFAQKTEQDVLRADVVVLQGARLVLGENDNLAGPLREPFEHWRRIVPEHPAPPAERHRAKPDAAASTAWGCAAGVKMKA